MTIQRYEYCYGKIRLSTRQSLSGPCAVLSRRSELILDLMSVPDIDVILWYTIGLIRLNPKHWPWWRTLSTSVDDGVRPPPCPLGLTRVVCFQERHVKIPNNREGIQSLGGMHLNWWGLFMTKSFECRMCHWLVRAPSFILNLSDLLWVL